MQGRKRIKSAHEGLDSQIVRVPAGPRVPSQLSYLGQGKGESAHKVSSESHKREIFRGKLILAHIRPDA